MPRYFFNHLGPNGERELDIDGLHLPSLHDALEEALVAAEGAIMIADGPIAGAFEVEDEGRTIVGRVPYRSDEPKGP